MRKSKREKQKGNVEGKARKEKISVSKNKSRELRRVSRKEGRKEEIEETNV